jgi:hypothetical protein
MAPLYRNNFPDGIDFTKNSFNCIFRDVLQRLASFFLTVPKKTAAGRYTGTVCTGFQSTLYTRWHETVLSSQRIPSPKNVNSRLSRKKKSHTHHDFWKAASFSFLHAEYGKSCSHTPPYVE